MPKKKTANIDKYKLNFPIPKGVILITIVIITVGFILVKLNNIKSPTDSSEKDIGSKSRWQEYYSSNGMFSFKYPEYLVYAYTSYGVDNKISVNTPHFFKSQKDADEAVNCAKNQQGTLEKPCKSGLFDVTDITKLQESAKTQMEKLPDTEVYFYTDSHGRKWIVSLPVYGIGGTQTNAETIDDKKYQVQFHIWDDFSDPTRPDATQRQVDFIKALLDTFKFAY